MASELHQVEDKGLLAACIKENGNFQNDNMQNDTN